MAFFNKKEEVMDLQLTQYGKYLLSQGDLKPVYYAFFDDDVLYDGNYAGVTEEQNAIRNRIEESVRPKTQYVFEGIETTINHNNKLIRGEQTANHWNPNAGSNRFGSEHGIQSPTTKNYAMALPLGNSDYLTEKAPAWSIIYLKGMLSSSQEYIGWPNTKLYETQGPNTKIPQLESKIKFETKIGKEDPYIYSEQTALGELMNTDFEINHNFLEDETFNDNTRFIVKEDYLILECSEENAPFLKDNFDIEVFEITSSTGPAGEKKELLLPLYFTKPRPTNIVNNVLIDLPRPSIEETAMLAQLPADDPSYVEHYFHINVDREIDAELMCNLIDIKKDKNTHLLDTYSCPDKSNIGATVIDAYETAGGITEEDIEKECD